jgi:hypothetical protein
VQLKVDILPAGTSTKLKPKLIDEQYKNKDKHLDRGGFLLPFLRGGELPLIVTA